MPAHDPCKPQGKPQGDRARRSRRWLGLAVFAALMAGMPGQAVQPDEILNDPALESRARRLSQELRCLVCQNQSIDDSNASLARDLRVLLRERLSAGDTDARVLAFVAARYGEFVLLRPPLNPHTLLLWFSPFLLFACAAVVLIARSRGRWRSEGAPTAPLSPEEQKGLQQLLGGGTRLSARAPENNR